MTTEMTTTSDQKALAPTMGGGATGEVLSSDIILPKGLLMQGTSEFVKARQAQMGDIVRSTPVEVLGGPDSPVEFIPLAIQNLWREMRIVHGARDEFAGILPRTAKNEHLPWEFERDGQAHRRVKEIRVFSLLPSDIAGEAEEKEAAEKEGRFVNLDKMLLPIVFSFKSTSFQAGRAVATHFVKAQTMGVPPYGYTMDLTCEEESNDQGSFYVFKVSSKGVVAPEYKETVENWRNTIASQMSSIQVDETEGAESGGGSSSPTPDAESKF